MKPFFHPVFLLGIILALAVTGLYEINKRNREIASLTNTIRELNEPHLVADWFIGGSDNVSDTEGINRALQVLGWMTPSDVKIQFRPRNYFLTNTIEITNRTAVQHLRLEGGMFEWAGNSNGIMFHIRSPQPSVTVANQTINGGGRSTAYALEAAAAQTNAHSGTNSISELRYEALWSGVRSALEYVEFLDKSIGFMAFEAENDRKRIDKIELILGTELRESILTTGKASAPRQTMAALTGHKESTTKRVWTTEEKEIIGYTMPRALVSTSDAVGPNSDPVARALLMQGIAVGVAIGRGHTTNEVPYVLLEDGLKLWAESRTAYMNSVTKGAVK